MSWKNQQEIISYNININECLLMMVKLKLHFSTANKTIKALNLAAQIPKKIIMKIRTILAASMLLALTSTQLKAQTLNADSLILVAIYTATGGSDWTKNENWLTGPIDTWQGITVEENRVTGVRFDQSGLNDSVPNEIFNLTALKDLYLFGTVGKVDDGIRNLTQLERLYFSNWALNFQPETLCEFPNLTQLTLLNCQGFSNIPICLTQKSLTRLSLSRMDLEGDSNLLSALASIPTLDRLNLSGNKITGEIAEELCQSNLVVLNLADNQLTGVIPECLNQNGTLSQIFLERNQLTGEIPTEIFKEGLQIFNVSYNQLMDTMDDWIQKPSSLYSVNLSNNLLNGEINGTFIGNNITTLDAAKNNFSGVSNIAEDLTIRVLKVDGNKLYFDDLQKFPIPTQTFTYNNQQPVNETLEMTINEGEDFTITMEDVGDSFTKYQWYLNDQILNEETSRNLTLLSVDLDNEGSYSCEATHDDFPDLLLYRNPVELTIDLSNSSLETKIPHVEFYPNPASNILNFKTEIQGLNEIRIIDFVGNLISVASYNEYIDTSHLPEGAYIIELVSKDHGIVLSEKLIISK